MDSEYGQPGGGVKLGVAILVAAAIVVCVWFYSRQPAEVKKKKPSRALKENYLLTGTAGGPEKISSSPSSSLTTPTADLPFLGRPPAAYLSRRKSSSLAGLPSLRLEYVSKLTPARLQLWYTDKLAADYSIIRDNQGVDGYSWNGLFLKPETGEVIAVYAVSRSLGLEPGAVSNPTSVIVWRVGRGEND